MATDQDRTRGHFRKGNESHKRKRIFYFHVRELPKISKFSRKVKQMFSETCSHRVSTKNDWGEKKKALEMDGGNSSYCNDRDT